MKVLIIGAGSVGRSIARELLEKGHRITLVDRQATPELQAQVPEASWVRGDAAELAVLEAAGIAEAKVLVAATGDDKVNLVVSLLAKTEFLVARTVARVSHPANEWMFGPMWGVDVAVSTPRMMTALVEEAVSEGRVVTLFRFAGSATQMVEITLPERSPAVGRTVGSMRWPARCVLVGIIRDGRPLAPTPHDALEAHDELLFLAEEADRPALQSLLVPSAKQSTADHDEPRPLTGTIEQVSVEPAVGEVPSAHPEKESPQRTEPESSQPSEPGASEKTGPARTEREAHRDAPEDGTLSVRDGESADEDDESSESSLASDPMPEHDPHRQRIEEQQRERERRREQEIRRENSAEQA